MIKRYFIEEEITVKDFLNQQQMFATVFKEIKQFNGQYLVNDQIVENWYQMKKGDLLEVVLPVSSQGHNIKSIKGELDILYEDSYFLILNKPNNLACIPTREHFENSLSNFVMSYYKRKGIVSNIHIVGRLDYATSGIIVFAKNPYIMALMKQNFILKEYLLEVKNTQIPKHGIIEGGIKKDPTSIIKRTFSKDFINSKTIYDVIYQKESSIIKAILCTGKTHQLRLHFSSLGCPIIGDELYGTKEDDNLLHLHSFHLKFNHPVTNQIIDIYNYPTWYNHPM